MTTNRDLDRQLGPWFEARATPAAPDELLERSLARVDATRQRPGWLVGGIRVSPAASGRVAVVPAWAILLLIAVAATAVVATGAGRFLSTSPATIDEPSPSPSVSIAPSSVPSPTQGGSPSPAPTRIEPSPSLTSATPLGGGLILVHDFQNEPGGPYNVLTLDAGTGQETRLGTLPGNGLRGYDLQWDADRKHILTSSELVPTEAGGAFTFICCNKLDGVDGLTLSPRGDRIAGIHVNGDRPDDVVIVDVAGGGSRSLPVPAGVNRLGGLAWSPDGSALVATGCRPCNKAATPQEKQTADHGHLYIVPLDGSPWRELLDDTHGLDFGMWSPDGSKIATVTSMCPPGLTMPRCPPYPGTLATLDVASGRATFLADVTNVVSEPVWSPDGGQLAFVGGQDRASFLGAGFPNAGVFVVNADGSHLVKLADNEILWQPTWSPDGQWLLFERASDHSAGYHNNLWIVPAAGGDPRLLGNYSLPAW